MDWLYLMVLFGQFYNTTNSELPYNEVSAIVFDENNNAWIATPAGLAKFDGSSWTIYNTLNSDLPDNLINDLKIDMFGVLWIATQSGGLVEFDGDNWEIYNPSNSDIPGKSIYSLATDNQGYVWVGTQNAGLAKYDGNTWSLFNTTNSGLPKNTVLSIQVDGNETKWIGTNDGGLACFNENGIPVSLDEINNIREEIFVYPNPFKTSTNIEFDLKKPGRTFVTIYNYYGQIIDSFQEERKSGQNSFVWTPKNIADGLYYLRLKSGNQTVYSKIIFMK